MLGVKMRQLRSEDVGNLRSSGRVRLSKLFHHERMRLAEIDRDSSDGRDRLVQLRPKAHELIDPFAPVRSIRPRPKIDLLDRPNPRGGCHEQRIKVGKVTKYGSLRHPGTPGDLSGARQVYRVGRAFPHDVENGTHNGLIVASQRAAGDRRLPCCSLPGQVDRAGVDAAGGDERCEERGGLWRAPKGERRVCACAERVVVARAREVVVPVEGLERAVGVALVARVTISDIRVTI